MSYLTSPFIVFTGDMQADVSTVNNDVRHYDVDTFKSRFQVPRDGDIMNGYWNPDGGSTFRFVNCSIKQCFDENGSSVSNGIVGGEVSGPKDRPSGKMVDLDPQMQFTSELWGVGIRVADNTGTLIFEGRIDPTGFRDAQTRQFRAHEGDAEYARNGQALGATWYSSINNIIWGNSSFAHHFKEMAEHGDGLLSIALHAFGYYYSHVDGRFSMSRIIGVIGPRDGDTREPVRFAPTRRLYGMLGIMSYTNFQVVDDSLFVDFAMSLPLQDPLGAPLKNIGGLILAVSKDTQLSEQPGSPVTINTALVSTIGSIDISDIDIMGMGGIIRFKLNEPNKSLITSNQLLLLRKRSAEEYLLIARESTDGYYVRADQNVLRLDPGDSLPVDFYIYQYGQSVTDKEIILTLHARASGGGAGGGLEQPTAPVPDVNFPSEAVEVTSEGKLVGAALRHTFSGHDPGNPRGYIDGQLYFYSYAIAGVANVDRYGTDIVIIHLRDEFEVPDIIAWEHIKKTWVQFGNLYPIMSKHIVDMNLKDALLARKDILIFALERDINEPDYMPVTRDLSKNKVKAMIQWLKTAASSDVAAEAALGESALPSPQLAEPSAATDELMDYIDKMSKLKAGDNSLSTENLSSPIDLDNIEVQYRHD